MLLCAFRRHNQAVKCKTKQLVEKCSKDAIDLLLPNTLACKDIRNMTRDTFQCQCTGSQLMHFFQIWGERLQPGGAFTSSQDQMTEGDRDCATLPSSLPPFYKCLFQASAPPRSSWGK